MSDEEIRVPAGLTTEGLLARRYLARLIDSFAILILILMVLGISCVLVRVAKPMDLLPVLLVCCVIWIGYGALLESSPLQATLGKRILGLRVYNSQGGRLTILQAAGRNLLKDGPFLLFSMIPGGQLLSFLWIVAHLVVLHRSPVNQALHDRAAHTWVAAPESTIQLRLT
jgi:uncharacterized RDD family membrane protein YckC